MTPAMLRQELESFKNINGYLPQVLLIHTDPTQEKETQQEISEVEKALDIDILPAQEGMLIEI
jgi:hypothetical protein